MSNIDPTTMREMMQALVDATILTEENGFYKIEEKSQMSGTKVQNALHDAESYLSSIRKQQLQIQDPEQKYKEDQFSVVKYEHKRHKFRIQAFVIKLVKKAAEDQTKLIQLSKEKFKDKGIEVADADIVKNFEELETKGYIIKDG